MIKSIFACIASYVRLGKLPHFAIPWFLENEGINSTHSESLWELNGDFILFCFTNDVDSVSGTYLSSLPKIINLINLMVPVIAAAV